MIFVTGGTGLLGAQLLLDLAKAGKKVRALKRASSSLHAVNLVFAEDKSLLDRIEWVEGDVTDPLAIADALKGIEEVYHCAAMVSFQPGDYEQMMKVNVEGTANMVNFSLEEGVKKFCHVSSVAAFGRIAGENNISEENVWKTSKENSNYAISKYSSEREVWRAIEEGLNAVIINPSIIIGPGDWKAGSPQMFTQVWNGLKFYTTGITGLVDVRDVTKCMISLLDQDIFSEGFIISGENISYRDVINGIAKELNRKPASIHATPFLGEVAWRVEAIRKIFTGSKPLLTKETARNGQHQWFISNKKIKRKLGIEFIPVQESIKRTAKIFLSDKVSAH